MRAAKPSVSGAFKKLAFGMTSAVRNCLLAPLAAAPRAGLAFAPVKRRSSPQGPHRNRDR